MKFDIDDLQNILNLAMIEDEPKREALRIAKKLAEEKKAEKSSSGPKPKGQIVVVLKGPKPVDENDTVGLAVIIPDGDDAGTVLDRLRGAAVDSNTGKGKKKVMIHTLLDIFAFLKPKWGKARDVKILTKEPVRIIYVSPEDDAKFIGG